MGSKSTSSPTTKHIVNTLNSSIQDNEGLAVANSNDNTFNVLDGGAIEKAFNFSSGTLSFASDFASDVMTESNQRVDDILGFSKSIVGDSLEKVSSAYKSGSESAEQDIIKIGLILVSVMGVVIVVFKK